VVWAALATVYLVWGSTYLAIRVMVETMPPLLAAGLRFAVAGGIFLAALAAAGGRERIRVGRREVVGAAVMGMLLPFGGNGLVTLAEQDVPSGLAALIIGSVPLWVVLLRAANGDRPPVATLLGVAIGFSGLALVILPGDRPGGAPLGGVLLCVAAAVSWASGSYYSRRLPLPRDALVSTAWQMLLGGGAMIVVALGVGEASDVHPGSFSFDSLAAFVYLITVGGLLAYTAYTWLLKNAPISTVATYAFVNPVIAIVLGWAILDEEITVAVVVGALAIVLSVAAVVRREGKASSSEEWRTTAAPTGSPSTSSTR
jgi:drug/metabolite transporter (DMT)-like permease